ncbi:hypothetical protein UXO45_09590 [Enterobacter hormaechei]
MPSEEIPSWNEVGVIPPMDMQRPTSTLRSPYKTDIVKLVERYSFSPQRIEILRGFLRFRNELYKTGLTDGFQWIDGSFIEDIELTEKRPPNDIDVVTFFNVAANDTQTEIVARNPNLFLPQMAKWRKQEFKVDSYLQSLQVPNAQLVERTVYWYSMWSHRRDLTWKGFLQVPLCVKTDQQALIALESRVSAGGEQ